MGEIQYSLIHLSLDNDGDSLLVGYGLGQGHSLMLQQTTPLGPLQLRKLQIKIMFLQEQQQIMMGQLALLRFTITVRAADGPPSFVDDTGDEITGRPGFAIAPVNSTGKPLGSPSTDLCGRRTPNRPEL